MPRRLRPQVLLGAGALSLLCLGIIAIALLARSLGPKIEVSPDTASVTRGTNILVKGSGLSDVQSMPDGRRVTVYLLRGDGSNGVYDKLDVQYARLSADNR